MLDGIASYKNCSIWLEQFYSLHAPADNITQNKHIKTKTTFGWLVRHLAWAYSYNSEAASNSRNEDVHTCRVM